jgi:hypothetical protein
VLVPLHRTVLHLCLGNRNCVKTLRGIFLTGTANAEYLIEGH